VEDRKDVLRTWKVGTRLAMAFGAFYWLLIGVVLKGAAACPSSTITCHSTTENKVEAERSERYKCKRVSASMTSAPI